MDELIVKEYLELNGFVTIPLRKGRSQSKRSLQGEGVDLYARNMKFIEGERDPSFLLFSSELRHLRSAIICVKGWHETHYELRDFGETLAVYVEWLHLSWVSLFLYCACFP